MVNLDGLSAHRKYDRSDMLGHIKRFPDQLMDGWKNGVSLALPEDYKGVDKVVIAGMGGSAIVGEVAGNLLAAESAIPVFVHRDFNLPPFVDGKTLSIVVSYSGNTEETLSAFRGLAKTPARKVVLTSGGELARSAREQGIPVSIIDYTAPPRATFAWIFGALAGILSTLGAWRLEPAQLESTATALRRMVVKLDTDVPLESNRAKQLATEVHGKIPVIYGGGVLSGAARRWKTQFNENSKNWAFFEVFPELAHNAIAGYSLPPQNKARLYAILLRSAFLNPCIKVQYDAVTDLLTREEIENRVIDAEGDSLLTQVMRAILLGDFTSYYLAILNKVDPTPLPAVDFVKSRMAEGKSGRS